MSGHGESDYMTLVQFFALRARAPPGRAQRRWRACKMVSQRRSREGGGGGLQAL